MHEIKNISKLVKDILIKYPDTRNSDTVLYLKVCETLNLSAMTKPFCVVLSSLKTLSLPPFETVRRSRQKIQRKCPELAGTDEVEEARAELEEIVRDWAKGDVI
jgi:hypothetical protein